MKNIRALMERPLIDWVLEALENSNYVDRIIVSTDCKEISECVKNLNRDKTEIFMRSAHTATDTASTESAMLDYIESTNLEADSDFILVQATSPWIRPSDIDQAYEIYKRGVYDSLLSVVPSHAFLWSQNGESLNYDYRKRPRRQDMPVQFAENGAFYLNRTGNIIHDKNRLSGKIGLYIMHPYSSIELDTEEDWQLAEAVMKNYIKKS